MDGLTSFIEITKDLGPAASIFILFLGLLFIVYKVFLPIVHDNRQESEAHRDGWKQLVDRQEQFCEKQELHYETIVEGLRSRMDDQEKVIESQGKEIETLKTQLAEKDGLLKKQGQLIKTLQRELGEVRESGELKDEKIKALERKLKEVENDRNLVARERDGLISRIAALESGKGKTKDAK